MTWHICRWRLNASGRKRAHDDSDRLTKHGCELWLLPKRMRVTDVGGNASPQVQGCRALTWRRSNDSSSARGGTTYLCSTDEEEKQV